MGANKIILKKISHTEGKKKNENCFNINKNIQPIPQINSKEYSYRIAH